MTIDYRHRPDLLADARALDRALRPVVDAAVAELGMTREELIAEAAARRAAGAAAEGAGEEASVA